MKQERITPERAEELLRVDGPQRNLKPTVLNRYITDMDLGLWGQCYDPIVVDKNGHVINGQHRLNAIIKSGKSHTFIVVEDAETDSIHTMDKGTPRSVNDDLLIKGITNRTSISAAARIVVRYDIDPGRVWSGPNQPTGRQVFKEVETNLTQYEWATASALGIAREIKSHATAVLAATYIIERDTSLGREFVDDFLVPVRDGIGLQADDARLAYRNHLMRRSTTQKRRGGSWVQQSELIILVRTWNKYLLGEPVKLVKTPTPNQLPMPKPVIP